MPANHEREILEQERRVLRQNFRSNIFFGTPLLLLILGAMAWPANRFLERPIGVWDVLIFIIIFRLIQFLPQCLRLRWLNATLSRRRADADDDSALHSE